MPRGKNYVNNNKGVWLQANSKAASASMTMCQYGAGCTRADCIYRHDGPGKTEEICLPFLAGKCSFAEKGCRKRHPTKNEADRLIAKYKRTRCRFGDECRTDGCLYLHPKEMTNTEPNYIEPHHVAFPPLNGAQTPKAPRQVANSAWKAVPPPVAADADATPTTSPPPPPTPHHHHQAFMPPPMAAGAGHGFIPENAYYYPDPAMMYPDQFYPNDQYYYPHEPYYVDNVPPPPRTSASFNANAKEFVPGSFAA